MVISLVTAALLAATAVLAPTIAEAAHPPPDTASPPEAHRTVIKPTPKTDASLRSTLDPLRDLPAANRGPWQSPVDGLDLLTPFDPPPLPWMPGHRGVDLGATDAQAVLAVGAGTVVFADDLAGRGVVSIAHANGLRTTYEPVEPLVAAGEEVAAGQAIGRLRAGHTSCSGAVCLHLGLKRGPLYLDPMLLFGAGKVRLLPRPGRPAHAASSIGNLTAPTELSHAPQGRPPTETTAIQTRTASEPEPDHQAARRTADQTGARP